MQKIGTMKTTIYLSLLLIVLLGALNPLNAQKREVSFGYDASGNMMNRVIEFKSMDNIAVEELDSNVNKSGMLSPGNNEFQIFNDVLAGKRIKIYPNPTTGILKVEFINYTPGKESKIEIFGLEGALKKRISQLKNSNTLNLSAYAKGTYLMNIYIEGESIQWKIIKK